MLQSVQAPPQTLNLRSYILIRKDEVSSHPRSPFCKNKIGLGPGLLRIPLSQWNSSCSKGQHPFIRSNPSPNSPKTSKGLTTEETVQYHPLSVIRCPCRAGPRLSQAQHCLRSPGHAPPHSHQHPGYEGQAFGQEALLYKAGPASSPWLGRWCHSPGPSQAHPEPLLPQAPRPTAHSRSKQDTREPSGFV